jgi:hypothetical protein
MITAVGGVGENRDGESVVVLDLVQYVSWRLDRPVEIRCVGYVSGEGYGQRVGEDFRLRFMDVGWKGAVSWGEAERIERFHRRVPPATRSIR